MALPDGGAVMVKYDTRITSPINGSIKLVRRDRTVILVKDSGAVSYNPRTGWDEGSAAAFYTDCADPYDGFIGAGNNNLPAQRLGRTATLGGNSVTFADSASSHRGYQLLPPQGPGSLTVSQSQVIGALGATAEASESMASFGVNKRKSVASAGSKVSRTSRSNSPSKQPSGVHSELSAASAASKSSTHSIIPLHAIHTKFTIDLVKFSCRVEDHEHNVFDVNMRDPLCPRVSLAGEVDGLKPVAITDTPKEPRVFIVNRSADAQEVLSMQDVGELERLTSVCPDAYKAMSDASSQPADLGDAKQHSYFVRRRSALPGDAFAFSEVFQGRPWQARERPATLSMALLQLRGAAAAAAAATAAIAPSMPSSPTHQSPSGRQPVGFFKEATAPDMSPLASPVVPTGPETGLDVSAEAGPLEQVVRPRTMLTVSLVERMPLSKDGYEQLNSDVAAWTGFRTSRVKAMDRFAVADNRSAEEVQEEEAIKKRIKAAYKAAKALAAKKKAQEKEALAGQAMADIAEEEDEDVDDSEEEEDEDPEEREVKAAFESFAEMARRPIERSDDAHHGDDDELLGGQVSYASLRPALIQLFNRNITHDMVIEAMHMAGFQAPKSAAVGLEDFRHVYQIMYDLLYPSDDADDSQLLSNASPGRSLGADDDEEDFDALERPPTAGGGAEARDAAAPAAAAGAVDVRLAESRPRSPSYWESTTAQKAVLPAPPPLDFRPLQWTSSSSNVVATENVGAVLYPAGSALQVVKNRKVT